MEQTLSAAAESCDLEVTFSHAPRARLRLSYKFSNRGRRNAYLFNVLYHDRPDGERIDRNLVTVEAEGARVLLGKKIVPVPEGTFVEKPYLPFVTRVEPGKSFEEVLELPLPLRPWTPYFMPPDSELRASAETAEAWFELGYFFAPPEGDALLQTYRTPQGLASYFDPFPIASQNLLRAGPSPVGLPFMRVR